MSRFTQLLPALMILLLCCNYGSEAGTTAPSSFVQAERQVVIGDYAGAIQLFTQCVAEDHTFADGYLERARCYIQINDFQRAFHDLQRYFALEPNSKKPTAYTRMGFCLTVQGMFADAVSMYTKAIELCPNYPNSYADRAKCYEKLGKYREAKRDLETCKSLGMPVPPEVMFRLESAGVVLRVARSSDTKVLEQTVHNQQLISQGLRIMSKSGAENRVPTDKAEVNAVLAAQLNMTETIRQQTKLIEEHKNSGEPYLIRAEAYLALRKYKEALADFDTLIASAGLPDSDITKASAESAYYGKASLLQTLGRHADAVQTYDEIIKRDDGSAEAHYGKGISLIRLGKCEEAIQSLDRSIALDPDRMQSYEARAQAKLSLGLLDAAAKDVKEAEKLKSLSGK